MGQPRTRNPAQPGLDERIEVMAGALVALLSAFAFSMNGVLVRRGVVGASPAQGAFISVLLGVPLFALAALVAGQLSRLGDFELRAYGLLALAGVIHFVLGRFFNYQAIAAIGAARTAPLQTLQIPYTVLVALVVLGEGVNFWMWVGIALVMVGPAIMVERPRAALPAVDAQGAIALRQREGYLFAVLSSVAYGTSPILIRAALSGEAGLAVVGGFVSYTAAAGLLLAGLVLPSQRSLIGAFRPAAVRAFFGAGVAIFFAQMLRFIALSLAPVAVVATLQRASIIFTLMLSWLMNRDLELLTRRLVAGVVVSVLGAVLLVVASVG